MAEQIFISYSHRDHEFVSRLALDLEDRGAAVWIDRMDIHAGEKWSETIAESIQACKAFLLVVSRESLKSDWAIREFRLAVQHNKPVIPLLYRKTRIPAHLRSELESYQYSDFGRGSYEQNLADLVTQLATHGVAFRGLSAEEIARRDRERLLGVSPPTRWGVVFGKIPGWAFAWALGWLVIWAIVPVVVTLGMDRIMGLSEPLDVGQLLPMPVCGFVGGFVGGLLAGLFTMLALRHNAFSVRWKHMSLAIRIWAVAGTIVCAVIFVLFLFGSEGPTPSESVDCTSLSITECFQESMGNLVGNIAGKVCLGVFAILFGVAFSTVGILIVGLLAGGVAVRRIRRLEPGILGRQAVWVVLGWGLGAIVALISSLYTLSLLTR